MLRGAVFAASPTQSLTSQVRRWEHRSTLAADLSRPPHPRRRSPLAAHGGIVQYMFAISSPFGKWETRTAQSNTIMNMPRNFAVILSALTLSAKLLVFSRTIEESRFRNSL
jgi:hypothetical protein